MSYKGIQYSGVFTNPSGITLFDPSWFGTGLVAWLAADQQVTVNGSNQVTSWLDLSGNGNSVTNSTIAQSYMVATNQQNTLPGIVPQVTTGGTYDWMQSASNLSYSLTRTTPYTLGVVMKYMGSRSTRNNIISTNAGGASDAGWQLTCESGVVKLRMYFNNVNAIIVTGSTVLQVGQAYDIIVTVDGSSTAAGVQIYIGGVAETMTIVEDNLTTPYSVGPLVIGGTSSTFASIHTMCEVAIMSIKASTQQIASLHQYFSQKWAA